MCSPTMAIDTLVSNLNDGLVNILALLTCPLCDQLFNNPISLECAHRYCERCVAKKIEGGMEKCFVCEEGSMNIRMPQYQLKIYICELNNFIRAFYKTYTENFFGAHLLEFLNWRLTLSQLRSRSIQGTYSPSQESQNDKNLMPPPSQPKVIEKKIFISPPAPSPKSLPIKKKPLNLFSLDNSVLIDKNALVDETICESPVKKYRTVSLDSVSETQKESSREQTIEQDFDLGKKEAIDFDFNSDDLSDIELESGGLPEINRREEGAQSSQISHMRLPEAPIVLEMTEDETPSTQSEYSVQKSILNYTHKEIDKFDRVMQITSPNEINIEILRESEVKEPTNNELLDTNWSGSPLFDSLFDSESDLFLSHSEENVSDP